MNKEELQNQALQSTNALGLTLRVLAAQKLLTEEAHDLMYAEISSIRYFIHSAYKEQNVQESDTTGDGQNY